MAVLKSIKLWTTMIVLSFSAGSFYVGQKYQTLAMLADGFISLAEHRAIVSKEVAAATLKTKTKTKAIARMKRALVAVPVAGLGLAAYFEKRDYDDWKLDHPQGTPQQYGCEISQISAVYVDELLQGLLENLSSRIPDSVMADLVPVCETPVTG